MSAEQDESLPFGMDDMLRPDYPDNLMFHAFLTDDDLRSLLSRLTGCAFEKPEAGEGVFDPSFEIIW